MDKYLSKTMILHSHTECHINVYRYMRYTIILQVCWISLAYQSFSGLAHNVLRGKHMEKPCVTVPCLRIIRFLIK